MPRRSVAGRVMQLHACNACCNTALIVCPILDLLRIRYFLCFVGKRGHWCDPIHNGCLHLPTGSGTFIASVVAVVPCTLVRVLACPVQGRCLREASPGLTRRVFYHPLAACLSPHISCAYGSGASAHEWMNEAPSASLRALAQAKVLPTQHPRAIPVVGACFVRSQGSRQHRTDCVFNLCAWHRNDIDHLDTGPTSRIHVLKKFRKVRTFSAVSVAMLTPPKLHSLHVCCTPHPYRGPTCFG